jgi:hypothetical protein
MRSWSGNSKVVFIHKTILPYLWDFKIKK